MTVSVFANAMKEPPIIVRCEPLSRQQIEAFAQATRSEHCVGVPPTFATLFRTSEFEWLERLRVDMHELLHTEQEYEYVGEIREGDVPEIATRIVDYRERRGLTFVTLESDLRAGTRLAVRSKAAFVVRSQASQEGKS